MIRSDMGDHCGDAASGSPAAGIDHNQQFHEMVVDRLAGGLNQKHIRAADSLDEGDGSLAIGKMLHIRVAQLDPKLLADGLSEFGVGVATENLNVFTVRNHQMIPRFKILYFFSARNPRIRSPRITYNPIISLKIREKQYKEEQNNREKDAFFWYVLAKSDTERLTG